MDKKELEKRTKKFALEVIKFVADLPKNKITNVLGYQLLKCGTSIGANYREANRAQSHQDFIHKIAIVEKEASETQYWLELFDAINMGDPTKRSWLLQESTELLARIFHEWSTATADMGILPGVLGFPTLRRTVQVRLGCKTLRLPGGMPIFTVS